LVQIVSATEFDEGIKAAFRIGLLCPVKVNDSALGVEVERAIFVVMLSELLRRDSGSYDLSQDLVDHFRPPFIEDKIYRETERAIHRTRKLTAHAPSLTALKKAPRFIFL